MRFSFALLLAILRAEGCNPQRVGPGMWLAACPGCRAEGRLELVCIDVVPGVGVTVQCAVDAGVKA